METNKHALCLSVVGDVPLKAAGTKHQQRLCRLALEHQQRQKTNCGESKTGKLVKL